MMVCLRLVIRGPALCTIANLFKSNLRQFSPSYPAIRVRAKQRFGAIFNEEMTAVRYVSSKVLMEIIKLLTECSERGERVKM